MPIDQSGHWFPPATVDPSELNTPHPPGYTYQTPIPEATTLTPGELLSKYYSNNTNTRDWTDPNGVLPKQQETYRYYPQYAVWPIGSSGLVAKWPRPGGLQAVPVPVYGAGSVARAGVPEVIQFRNQDRQCPSKGVFLMMLRRLARMTKGTAIIGIKMDDIFRKRLGALEGAMDIVFHGLQEELSFVIKWPGYDLQKSTIRTQLGGGRRLTRFDLAARITMEYASLFKKVEDEFLLPSEIGFFNIALHQGRNAKQDSLGVQLMQLYLVSFFCSNDGNWVAEVDIV